jgi:hypothetical protein
MAFVVRPLAVFLHGSTILTESLFSSYSYNIAYLNATCYCLVFYLTAIFVFHKKITGVAVEKVRKIEIANSRLWTTLIFCIIFCLIFLFVGGVGILFTNRAASIATVAPSLRYIYPFAIVFLCIGSMQGAVIFLQNERKKGALLLFFYLVVSSIIGQRGFFIIFAVLGTTLVLRTRNASITQYLLASVPISFVMVLAIYSKTLMTYLASGGQLMSSVDKVSIAEKILVSPDSDATEVWMRAYLFVSEQGYLFGTSLVNNFFNIFSHVQRREWGLMNGSDILNGFFTGDVYWDYGFGFNVTLPIELYLNFGIYGIIPVCLVGGFFGRVLRDFDGRVIFRGRDPSWEALKLYALYTLCSSLAGLQWSVLFYAVFLLTRIKLRASYNP